MIDIPSNNGVNMTAATFVAMYTGNPPMLEVCLMLPLSENKENAIGTRAIRPKLGIEPLIIKNSIKEYAEIRKTA